jgi:chemotaxis protein MotC
MNALRPILMTSAVCSPLLLHASGVHASGLDAEPYKLVRSLQRVQDEIADGDKSALGMQRELTKLIDKSFARLDRSEFADPKNARALISYAMLGGNPATLEAHLTDLGHKEDEFVRLAVAILIYQKGGARVAESRLKDADPLRAGGLFGASLALVRGLVTRDDDKARADFDTARLLAPGTLIEEAALRRLMTIHRRRQDPVSFLRVSSRYARRFVASPYAMQFAQEFVAGVIALGEWMDMANVFEVIEFMPEPYRSAVTVRLMRVATVAGKSELVKRVAELTPAQDGEKADEAHAVDPEIDARQRFYAQISQITSENVREVAGKLRNIDTKPLADGDRDLLRAVLAIADAVTDPKPLVPPGNVVPAKGKHESIFHDAPKQQTEPVLNDFEDFVGGTREALQGVDKLLEDIQ